MASSSYQTHYEILGISQQAQLKEVRDAYRKLALKCHPDKDLRNPRAAAVFQKLSAAYETLSDENRRTKYDATLSSRTRARQPPQPASSPSQRAHGPNATTRAWYEDTRQRPWDWLRRAQERADQARRNDDEFWSGPTYAHGATDRHGMGKQWDRKERDRYDLHGHQHQQRQHAASRKAHKETEREEYNMNRPSPAAAEDPSDRATKESKAWAKDRKTKQGVQEEAGRERCEDDGYIGGSPPPQNHDPDWWTKVEKDYQERLEKEKKERADRRKAKRDLLKKRLPADLPLLLTKIISIEVEIGKSRAKVEDSKRATKDVGEDDDHEQIFDLPIKQKFMERRLYECLKEYRRILRLLRDWGWEQEANEAEIKLREASKEVARDMRVGGNGSSRRRQAGSTTETHTKTNAEIDHGKPLANNKGSHQYPNLATPQIPIESMPRSEYPFRTTLPVYDGPRSEDTTRQRQDSVEYEAYPTASYDGSDPDRGFTEDTPERSRVGDDDNNTSDWNDNPTSCNDFHDSHMEVHREFWDIIDSSHECDLCHNLCAVLRCPKCDVQACAYCKDTHG